MVGSMAFSDGVHMHTFGDIRELMDEAFCVKMYAEVHFYHSLNDAKPFGERGAGAILRARFNLRHGDADRPRARDDLKDNQ